MPLSVSVRDGQVRVSSGFARLVYSSSTGSIPVSEVCLFYAFVRCGLCVFAWVHRAHGALRHPCR